MKFQGIYSSRWGLVFEVLWSELWCETIKHHSVISKASCSCCHPIPFAEPFCNRSAFIERNHYGFVGIQVGNIAKLNRHSHRLVKQCVRQFPMLCTSEMQSSQAGLMLYLNLSVSYKQAFGMDTRTELFENEFSCFRGKTSVIFSNSEMAVVDAFARTVQSWWQKYFPRDLWFQLQPCTFYQVQFYHSLVLDVAVNIEFVTWGNPTLCTKWRSVARLW